MRFRLLLLANSFLVGLFGFFAIVTPMNLSEAYLMSASPESVLLVRLMGVLLLGAGLLSWLVADSGDTQARGAIFLTFALGWVTAASLLLSGWLSGALQDVALIPLGIAIPFASAFAYAWFSTRGTAWRVGPPMSNREILVWILVILATLVLLVAIFLPVIWGLTISKKVPNGITSIGSSAELIVALVSIGIALAGAGIYRLVREQLISQVQRQSKVESYHAIAQALTDFSFDYWLLYTSGEGKSPDHRPDDENYNFLDRAIETSRRALDRYCEILDPANKAHHRSILSVKNNLAYYIAERKKHWEDKIEDDDDARLDGKLACSYVEELKGTLLDFPVYTLRWEDTIAFVTDILGCEEEVDVEEEDEDEEEDEEEEVEVEEENEEEDEEEES